VVEHDEVRQQQPVLLRCLEGVAGELLDDPYLVQQGEEWVVVGWVTALLYAERVGAHRASS
jgi:hypothetical protein